MVAAYELARRGYTPGDRLLVLDSNDGPGGAWRHRWDSLTLGKAHGIADLPGMKLGTPDPTVPASVVVADYYGRYEDEFGLKVLRPVTVGAVHDAGGGVSIDAVGPDGPLTISARVVVNATGTWTNPFVPFIPGADRFRGTQLRTVDYVRPEDFDGERVLVVGGGLSAVQFLLPISRFAASTTWATRRPPNFTDMPFFAEWGIAVEKAVKERTTAGLAPASVVRTTGIPLWPDYVAGVRDGVLVSRGMVSSFGARSARFDGRDGAFAHGSEGLGPSASDHLVLAESWQPFDEPTEIEIDTVLWATGFRAALAHLAPLKLREPGGGITMADEVSVAKDDRIYLVGYGSSASTTGATRAGRAAGRAAARRLAR